MEFSEKKRVIIFISVIVGLLAALVLIILVVLRMRANSPTTTIENTDTVTAPLGDTFTGTEGLLPPPVEPVVPEDAQERYVKQVSEIFVERFQTYSSHNDNSHINDVLGLVTTRMAAWVESQTATQQRDYQGVTTQVISRRVTSYTANSAATVTIGVQQVVEDTTGQKTVYKNGRVELLFTDGEWKVDGLFWE